MSQKVLTKNRNGKLKVCIISNTNSAHVQRWANILISKGCKISIVTNSIDEGYIEDAEIIESLSKYSKHKIVRLMNEFGRALFIRYTLSRLKPDVVHIHSFDYIHPFMIFLISIFTGGFNKLVVSTWGTDVITSLKGDTTFLGDLSKKLLLRKARCITASSKYLASVTSRLAPPDRKIHVIPFGIDCVLFSRISRKRTGPLRIGFVKHLKPVYGPDYLLRAFSIVSKKRSDIKLILVGEGAMKADLVKLSKDLGIDRNVSFIGYVPNKQIPAVLKEIDILVMPSILETFGVAALEAQSMEIPVIASNSGGVPEVVVDKVTGFLVEPKDYKGLAQAIQKLIDQPGLREKMGKAGRRFVLKNYRIEDNADKLISLYENLKNGD